MMTLRCTHKLLQRLPRRPSDVGAPPPVPTTALGDWYATLLFTRPRQLVVCVSERSRLCVLLPARALNTLAPRFRRAVEELLRAIGISEAAIAREARAMEEICLGSTRGLAAGRSVLGTLSDFAQMVQISLETREWLPAALSAHLSETPCGPLRGRSPREVTLELLEKPS